MGGSILFLFNLVNKIFIFKRLGKEKKLRTVVQCKKKCKKVSNGFGIWEAFRRGGGGVRIQKLTPDKCL